jgi:hypothetical protein
MKVTTIEITGFCVFSILIYSKEYNVSETASVSVLRRERGRHLLCWFR